MMGGLVLYLIIGAAFSIFLLSDREEILGEIPETQFMFPAQIELAWFAIMVVVTLFWPFFINYGYFWGSDEQD